MAEVLKQPHLTNIYQPKLSRHSGMGALQYQLATSTQAAIPSEYTGSETKIPAKDHNNPAAVYQLGS